MPEVSFCKLSKAFGPIQVLDQFALQLHDRELLVLLGPSGVGKSTLLRLLAGLDHPSSGDILFDGSSIIHRRPHQRNLAMVFQDFALYPHMSVYSNIAFPLRSLMRSRREVDLQVHATASRLGLSDLLQRKPAQLSMGQQQRLAVARAVAKGSQLLCLDEPMSSVDFRSRDELRAELRELHQQLRMTTLFVTHNQFEAMQLADRIAVMRCGRIEQVGTPEDIYRSPQSKFVAEFIGFPKMNFLPGSCIGEDDSVVRVGIRPECVHFGLQEGETISFSGVVREIQFLGSQTQVVAAVGDDAVTVMLTEPPQLEIGAQIAMHARNSDIHRFDAQTGERIP